MFNALTGLYQKTGNYPGITVESSKGKYKWKDDVVEVVDLPGTYSLYPNSKDELVVSEELLTNKGTDGIDAVVYVSDITMLEKELLLLTQVMDLEYPVILALNMADMQSEERIKRIKSKIQSEFGICVIDISARHKTNLSLLKDEIRSITTESGRVTKFTELPEHMQAISESVSKLFPDVNDYGRLLICHHYSQYSFIKESERTALDDLLRPLNFDSLTEQMDETMYRYEKMSNVIRETNLQLNNKHTDRSRRIDRWAGAPGCRAYHFSCIDDPGLSGCVHIIAVSDERHRVDLCQSE